MMFHMAKGLYFQLEYFSDKEKILSSLFFPFLIDKRKNPTNLVEKGLWSKKK